MQVGEAYEVAEVLETPGRLMVRPVGASTWPAPWEWKGSVDAYLFEESRTPISIVSCGYVLHELFGYYGVEFRGDQSIDRLAAFDRFLDEVEYPKAAAIAEQWIDAQRGRIPPGDGAALFELIRNDCPQMPEIRVVKHAIIDAPPARRLVAVSYHVTNLSEAFGFGAAGRRVREVCRLAGVSDVEPEGLQTSYWTGDGSPRLIN